MTPYDDFLFLLDLFYLAWSSLCWPMLIQIASFCSLLTVKQYYSVCVCMYVCMDTQVASIPWLLWMMLLWTLGYPYLFELVFSFWGDYRLEPVLMSYWHPDPKAVPGILRSYAEPEALREIKPLQTHSRWRLAPLLWTLSNCWWKDSKFPSLNTEPHFKKVNHFSVDNAVCRQLETKKRIKN